MSDSVLILGAAGRLGRCLVQAFSQAGWKVLAQARKPLPADVKALPRVEAIFVDGLDPQGLAAAAQGAQVVVNALNPVYTEWGRLALPLADAAKALALELDALLMLPGNVYNFGSQLPAVLTRNTPEQGDTPKARIRIEIESQMAAAAAQGLRSLVLRSGDFFGGSGTGSWFDLALASRVAKGKFIYPGAMDQVHAWAYLPDLAQCFVQLAALRSRLNGHIRLQFAGHAVTGSQMHAAMQEACGRDLQVAGMPWWLIRAAAPLVPIWRELLVMRYLWQRPHRLDDSDLCNLIGTPPHTELRAALRAGLSALQTGPEPWSAQA